MMQKLSGVKRSQNKPAGSGSAPFQHQLQGGEAGGTVPDHHHSNETLPVNSHSDPHTNTNTNTTSGLETLTFQSSHLQQQHPPDSLPKSNSSNVTALTKTDSKLTTNLSRRDSDFAGIARRERDFTGMSNEDDSQSQWTAGLFTDMDFMNGSSWIHPTPVEPSSDGSHSLPVVTIDDKAPSLPCNGASGLVAVESEQISRKRPHPSSSPAEMELSLGVSSPAHKKHKSHGDKITKKHRHHHRLVVRVPLLEGIHLNHHKFGGGLVEEKKHVIEGSGAVGVRPEGREELVVSIPQSLLRGRPLLNAKRENVMQSQRDAPDNRTTNWSHDLAHKSHDPTYPAPLPPPAHKQARDQTESQNDAALHHQKTDSDGVIVCMTCRRTLQPEWARPGLDGCIGCDGYWYEWTDHICSLGEEVTIMPYIYIEDDNACS